MGLKETERRLGNKAEHVRLPLASRKVVRVMGFDHPLAELDSLYAFQVLHVHS